MSNIWFFDRYGAPQLILRDEVRFVDKQGKNVGIIRNNNKIYNYSGKHCGWIEGYIVRDLNGHTVAFSKYSHDHPSPIFPIPQIPPIPAIPQIPPIPAIPQIPYIKPIKSFGWSTLSPSELFR